MQSLVIALIGLCPAWIAIRKLLRATIRPMCFCPVLRPVSSVTGRAGPEIRRRAAASSATSITIGRKQDERRGASVFRSCAELRNSIFQIEGFPADQCVLTDVAAVLLTGWSGGSSVTIYTPPSRRNIRSISSRLNGRAPRRPNTAN
jgi:hypothetical protein